MALVFDGPVTPDSLTTFVREVPTPAEQVLSTILPNRNVNTNRVDISELTRTNRTARFRAYDARLHVSERDVATTRLVKLPALSSSLSVGEFERLQLEFARLGGTNQAAIIDAIYDDATILTKEIHNRMELARGDVLTDGKFTLAGEGQLTMEADYGVPGTHIVTAATPWSTVATATIIANLTTWVNVYIASNGSRPTGMIISQAVLNYMLQNAELRSLSQYLTGTPGLLTRPDVDRALANYGLPPIALVYDSKVDVDGVTTDILPADRVIMFGDGVGYTAWGISATALELVGAAQTDLSFSDAPGIVGVVVKEGPPFRQFTFVDAVGMPVIEQPKRLFIADVA
jgi:hypothetical protein